MLRGGLTDFLNARVSFFSLVLLSCVQLTKADHSKYIYTVPYTFTRSILRVFFAVCCNATLINFLSQMTEGGRRIKVHGDSVVIADSLVHDKLFVTTCYNILGFDAMAVKHW